MESRAIVLRTLKYNDRSNIVEVFSHEAGPVSFLVNVPKSSHAAVKNVLFRPMALLELTWNHRQTATLQRVKGVKCYAPFSSIPYDPYKTAMALFLAEFLHHALREERESGLLFDYIESSVLWLDARKQAYANFHLVFLMRLSRFLGFFPNMQDAREGAYFDMQNSCFTSQPPLHEHYVQPTEAIHLPTLMRMGYATMHLFALSHTERNRLLTFINDYYRLHIPSFPTLKSLDVLQAVFG